MGFVSNLNIQEQMKKYPNQKSIIEISFLFLPLYDKECLSILFTFNTLSVACLTDLEMFKLIHLHFTNKSLKKS